MKINSYSRSASPRGVAIEDPRLCVDFQDIERDGDKAWRWTAGRACPDSLWAELDGDAILRIDVADSARPR